MNNKKFAWLSVLSLIFSFIATGFLSITSLQEVIADNNKEIAESVAVSIYNDINNMIIEPKFVSNIMANDSTLLNAIKINDVDYFIKYLKYVKDHYKYDTAFFVNDATGEYYTNDGRALNVNNWATTGWYFELRDNDIDFNMNINYDEIKWHELTVFMNKKIFDEKGNYVGLCGFGTKFDVYTNIFEHYKKSNGITAYIVDSDGKILIGEENEAELPNLAIAASKSTKDSQFNYFDKKDGGSIVTKYLDDLDLQLAVVTEKIQFKQFSHLILRLVIIFVAVMLVVAFGIYINISTLQGNYLHQFEMAKALAEGIDIIYYVDFEKNSYIIETFTNEMKNTRPSVLNLVQNTEKCFSETAESYCKTFVHPDDYERILNEMQTKTVLAKLSKRQSYYIQYKTKTKDSHQGYMEMHITKAISEQKKHTAFFTFRNIDEQRKKEIEQQKTLEETFQAAKRANSAKTEFMAHMSHDIRTPLNAIIGMTGIAETHLNEPEKVKGCLTKIESSSRFLLNLVNEVLDMNRIESGKLELDKEAFRIEQLIEEFNATAMPLAAGKKHSFTINMNDIQHQNVLGDKERIHQVLMNFMSNAVKYTPENGEISLTVREVSTNRPKRGCYEFIFEDNGIGMDSEFAKKIFEPFARADDERVTEQQGTGLGMSIAMTIIQMMNGDVQVQSELNKGSKFIATIFLELQDSDITTENSDSPELFNNKPLASLSLEKSINQFSKGEFKGKRILLVEDNEINAEIAKEIIEMSGAEVVHAWNGQEAVSKMQESQDGYYDIIFMDIQMPVLGGYDATKNIRTIEREYCKQIPIVAMSANAFAEDVRMSKLYGMQEHIAKPLDFNLLYEVLKNYIG